jgi:Fe-S cluster biogenesis protein NfuA
MFIQTENTPNPNTVKFLPGKDVMAEGVAEFTSLEESACSMLAQRIFGLKEVERVFFGADFISVTKSPDGNWDAMKTLIMAAMMDHYMTGMPLFREGMEPNQLNDHNDDGEEDELTVQIKELLDTRVRPMVAMDGGDIVFEKFDKGIVYLKMRGACAGCPSSTMTLKGGIENMLRHYVPEVLEVRQVEDY